MKRKHFSILGSLLILMGGLPTYLCATEDGDSSVSTEAEKRIKVESRQDHVVQVMSKRLCSEYGKKQAESLEQNCVFLIAEMAKESTKSQEYTSPSLENVNWSGVAGVSEVASELGSLQQAEAGTSDLDGSILIAEKAMGTDSEEIVATQEADTAIPGSLLVTILALVGIVAVARRDVSGKQNPDPVVRSGAEVARISSLQEGTKVDILHGRLN